jgi:hypothetical protein
MVCEWQISGNAKTGTFGVTATTSKEGYKSASGSDSFEVILPTDHQGGGGDGSQNLGADRLPYNK